MGKLFICGTPIGNLEDVSVRLLKTLRRVDLIACEDTRHTAKLLARYKIKKPLISYHEHSGQEREAYILKLLREGKNIALVSDAGMPGISDPGAGLIKKAIEEGIPLEVVPGPSALVSALALSGMDTSSFVFVGFLPAKEGAREKLLQELKREKRTLIFYEAPHRLVKTLQSMAKILGEERRIAVAREITKLYEEVRRGSLREIERYFAHNPPKGEFTLIVEGDREEKEVDREKVLAEVKMLIDKGMDKKEALKMKAREYKIKKSELYKSFLDEYDD
ncbi:16S rRNA (cytidine1402-2'-O)-methyltransferase [Thermosyntropha lipolytica DSM 11003]|uniref:Ribosomal RNA small subunit methyltransferase I n=2 Tax=Thermosyntropha TaxID=54293 RepID=A0A1M5JMJ3_9FIRM|nr:16S rRNA (cytidine1402-2'-O)-methyltransferase [Thermosyntropha lipolytica DSM 11003]